jgi:TRAP transporter TAXI family solute receptor
MKKWLMALASATLVTAAGGSHAQNFINILTGGSSGVYYPLGVAISQKYKEALPDARIQVQATKASVENLNLLERGRGELAFALADSVADAWTGVADAGFAKPLKKLRSVGAIYPNYIHIVARADSGIRSLADLKGKRISVGAPRSGTELNARAVFKAAGLSYQDFSKTEYLPYSESVELMKNRQLDATLQSSGLGMAAFRDLATAVPVVFIPIPAEVVARIANPAYQPSSLPAATYEGQKLAVPTVAVSNLLMTHDKVPDEIVYQMTRQVYENIGALGNAHNAARAIALERATVGLTVPLHPGAERYYREKNVLR